MRERPGSREGRKPAAKEHDRAKARNRDHAGVFRDEKHREFEARILRIEARNEFLLRFGKIERRAISFRDRRYEEAKEAEDLRPHIPAEDAPLGMTRLG